jgi:hypoxanthine phosphoribosyltransferase
VNYFFRNIIKKQSFLFFLFFYLIFFIFSYGYNCNNSEFKQYVYNYLYAIKRIYQEDIFVKQDLYNIFKRKIEELFTKKNYTFDEIDELFKNTLYFYSNDSYLKIYKKDIFNQQYFNDKVEISLEDKINIILIKKNDFLIYYIKIYYFPVGYYKYFRDYLFSYYKEEHKDLKKIVIIDLIDNSGGSLYTASFFINLFYPPKSYLFTIHYKNKSVNYYSGEDYKDYFRNAIVFVVQNDMTASSAEVVSGVLKRKGIILGDFSYGKPFIQVNLDANNFTILYTNSFLNFNTTLEPHEKVKPDVFLSYRELNKEFILNLVFSFCYYLFFQIDRN